MKNQKFVYRLSESAMFVALAFMLSFIKVFQMPLGGAVTLASMLPICIIGLRHGPRWGFGSAFVYSLAQLLLGITVDGLFAWGLTPICLLGCIFLDYILAYSVLGVASLFRKNVALSYVGICLSFLLRFGCHVISGYVIFQNLEQWTVLNSTFADQPLLYSIAYNGFYILPETALSLVFFSIMVSVPFIRGKIFGNPRKQNTQRDK